ncbi:hypothetical protein [Ruminococcus sp.]|uniref:hypothetical protein n=1 Tax=Ruminococcus sp. TaxID=41978 RepID=UPI00386F63D5
MKKSIISILTASLLAVSISATCITANAAVSKSQAKENLENLLIENYWYYNQCTKENGFTVNPNIFYTEYSYNNFYGCYEKGLDLYHDYFATDESIVDITNQFEDAKNSLVRNDVEMTAENTATPKDELYYILIYNSWDFDFTPEYWYMSYTKESYDAYTQAKNDGWLVFESSTSTDIDYDTAWKNFIRAKWHLEKIEIPTAPQETTATQFTTAEVVETTDPVQSTEPTTESVKTTEKVDSATLSVENTTNLPTSASKSNSTADTEAKQNSDVIKTGSQGNSIALVSVLLICMAVFGLVYQKKKTN